MKDKLTTLKCLTEEFVRLFLYGVLLLAILYVGFTFLESLHEIYSFTEVMKMTSFALIFVLARVSALVLEEVRGSWVIISAVYDYFHGDAA